MDTFQSDPVEFLDSNWDVTIPKYESVQTQGEVYVIYRFEVKYEDKYFWKVTRRFSECFTLHVEVKKAFPHSRFPHYPRRCPGILKDLEFLENRRKDLEYYFKNLPPSLFLHPLLKDFLEVDKNLSEQGFDMDMLSTDPGLYGKTESLRMHTTFDFSSCLPWLQDELDTNSFIILIFYRGSWCPYTKPHIQTCLPILAAVRSAGGNIFGTSAEGNKETVNFMNELQSQLELISDPSASLGLRFHLNILKTTHASHPLQLITKPALLAIRRKKTDEKPVGEITSNVSADADLATRKKIIAEENPDIEVIAYQIAEFTSTLPNIADFWNLVVKPELEGKRGTPEAVSSGHILSVDIWKVKDAFVGVGSPIDTSFLSENDVRKHIVEVSNDYLWSGQTD